MNVRRCNLFLDFRKRNCLNPDTDSLRAVIQISGDTQSIVRCNPYLLLITVVVPDVLFQQGKRLVIQLDFISMTTEHNVRAVTLLVSLAPQYRIRQQFTGRGSLSVSEPRTDPTDYQSMMGRSGHLIGVAVCFPSTASPRPER